MNEKYYAIHNSHTDSWTQHDSKRTACKHARQWGNGAEVGRQMAGNDGIYGIRPILVLVGNRFERTHYYTN